MPGAVTIKAGNYGTAIRMPLERGGAFQTRDERTLIVNAEQRKDWGGATPAKCNSPKISRRRKHRR